MLKGTGVSDGIGIGKILVIEESSLEYTPKKVTDIKSEKERLNSAVEHFCQNAQKQADALKVTAGEADAEIILGHISIVKDPYLIGEIEKLINDGHCAEAAFENICDMFINIFSSADDELTKQRAADIRDIKTGVMKILLGIEEVNIGDAPKDTILAVKELTPSMVAGINRENIAGIITETGGTTSHSAILARILEMPAVMGVPDLLNVLKNGDTVIIDGNKGEVLDFPDNAQLEHYNAKREQLMREKKALESFRGKATISADGEIYQLVCNIGEPDDAAQAVKFDGEGVGLFRTEFLFMNKTSLPTEEEQFKAYKKAALILKGKPLVIRTLDIGGDKDIPYMGLKKEANPFMGFRAIRYCLKNRDIFKTQLRAVLRASSFGNISVMFPLITCIEEFREGKALIEEVKSELKSSGTDFDENIKVGIMVETASAAVIADILAKEADFFSIGTNDLTGYTMSCDRGNSDVSYLYSVFQPSVLRMIKHIIKCARENNIPVGMCGEAASDPMMIPLLISYGLTEFSVSPPSVLKVRKCISSWTKQKADKVTEKVAELDTEQSVHDYLKTVI